MKLKLYRCFEKWSKYDSIWVYSDPHFNDPDCKLIHENWPTPEEQVKIINSKVHKNDVIIFLGDIGDVEWISKIKSYKVLITGNHDAGVTNYERKQTLITLSKNITKKDIRDQYPSAGQIFETKTSYIVELDNKLFDEVYDGPLFINPKILLSHEPIKLPFGINIHGHKHGKLQHEYWANESVMINVCADVRNFTPVRLDKIIEGYKIKDIHRLTIDKNVFNLKEGGK